jgi:hypothetical protein
MELFPDEAHVRLRSRVHGTYLNAEEDGVGMGLRRLGASLNQAWAVHRLDRGGTTYVLLLGAAYGRYLAFVRDNDAPPGQGNNASHDCRFVQRVYDAPGQEDVLFEVAWAEDGSGDVLMRHCTFGWVHNPDNPTRMSWVVEAIPPLEDPPELPNVIPVSHPSPSACISTNRSMMIWAEQSSWRSIESAIFFVQNYFKLWLGSSPCYRGCWLLNHAKFLGHFGIGPTLLLLSFRCSLVP